MPAGPLVLCIHVCQAINKQPSTALSSMLYLQNSAVEIVLGTGTSLHMLCIAYSQTPHVDHRVMCTLIMHACSQPAEALTSAFGP